MDPERPAAPLWYLAYGSNMGRWTFVGRRRIHPLETRCARLDGYRVCFDIPVGPGERAVANVEPAAGACVWGVLYRLTAADAARLDRSEGVGAGIYRRIPVEVTDDRGERIAAFAYRSEAVRPGRKPSARYMGLLLEGARQHGLPAEYVRALEAVELARDERPQEDVVEKRVRYYFAYNSPYAFLANSRLERELAPFRVEVEYKPVYSPRAGGAPDLQSPRFRYLFEDVTRFAEAYGLALRPGPFADSRRACLGFFHARREGRGRAYHDGVYEARWLRERDIGDADTLAEVAEAAGLERAPFVAALEDPRYEAALAASNGDAQTDGVFGFPFFIYGGKRFWGNDRLEWLVRELAKG